MLKVIAEQEHYLLISDGQRFTVVEALRKPDDCAKADGLPHESWQSTT